jgi:cardiolipin synthase (CMP-forming)
MPEPVLTVANQLTFLRLGLAPLLVVLVLARENTWALVVFVVAAVTDALDGLAARHGSQQTTLGTMLDPVADKILMGSAYVCLTWVPGLVCSVPVWLTVTLLFRDAVIVMAVALINLTVERRVFPPSLLGKAATALQIVTAGFVLLANAVGDCPPAIRWLFWTTLVTTIVSALHYVHKAAARRPEAGGGD